MTTNGQSRIGSFIEALVNVAIGYLIALAAQLAVFPMFGIHVPLASNIAIGGVFTGVSIARSYLVRRYFNSIIHRACK